MNIKLMSFNIQHGAEHLKGKKINLGLMADVIRRCGADIVGLNEVRGHGADPEYTDQAKEIADRLGYHFYFGKAIDFPNRGPYGNAILSRFPIAGAKTIPVEDPPRDGDPNKYYETRCLIRAEFALPRKLTVFVSHFGLVDTERKNAVDAFLREAARTDSPYLFLGDFNMTPDDPLLVPLYGQMRDTARVCGTEKPTFPSDAPDKKIDYIFASEGLAIHSAEIPGLVASDHLPHTATVSFA